MNPQERAILATKMAIEGKYGSLGGFAFDHILHTVKLMYQSQGTGETTMDLGSLNLDEKAKARLQQALADTQSRAQEGTKRIISDSHRRFARTMGMTGIEVTYGYSGDPKESNATRTLILGDMSAGGKTARIDLSEWVKIGVELY